MSAAQQRLTAVARAMHDRSARDTYEAPWDAEQPAVRQHWIELARAGSDADPLRDAGDELVAALRHALDGVGFDARLDAAVQRWEANR